MARVDNDRLDITGPDIAGLDKDIAGLDNDGM